MILVFVGRERDNLEQQFQIRNLNLHGILRNVVLRDSTAGYSPGLGTGGGAQISLHRCSA